MLSGLHKFLSRFRKTFGSFAHTGKPGEFSLRIGLVKGGIFCVEDSGMDLFGRFRRVPHHRVGVLAVLVDSVVVSLCFLQGGGTASKTSGYPGKARLKGAEFFKVAVADVL